MRLAVMGVSKRYGATRALAGVTLGARAGEVLAVVGENGAGKSTLMRLLAGAERPDEGSMRLDGEAFAPASPAEARARGVAMIHQELAIAPHLGVGENVMLGSECVIGRRTGRRERAAIARRALDRVGLAGVDARARAGDLPPAGRQQIEIARAIAVRSSVVILDEPTSSLGRDDASRLFGIVRALRDEGRGVVYISHALEEVIALAARYVVLRDGRVVGEGPMASMTPDAFVALMAGAGEPASGVGTRPAAIERAAGAEGPSPDEPDTREPLLVIDRLSGRRLPVEATIRVHRGEVVGIAGLVGSGRTELLRAVFGLDEVRSGRVVVGGAEGWADARSRWMSGVGFVSEDRKGEGLALGMSIADNAALPVLDRWLGRAARRRDRARASLEAAGVRMRSPSQRVGELSGGNQQKVALARLVHARCDVLVLDEPTRGVDAGARARLIDLIRSAARGEGGGRAGGAGVLVASSSIQELLELCDRIAVMRRGRLSPARRAREWTEHAILAAATGGGT